MPARFQPWLDRKGQLSWLKLVTFIGLFLPALWIAYDFQSGGLQPKPVTEAIHQIGTWAVRFLLLSLAVSPLRRLAGWTRLIAVRRMLGLAALAYVLVHFGLYIVDLHFDLGRVASEIVLRFYLTIGFLALLGLTILGCTSTDGMIRRIGPARWNRLHRIVYVLVFLGLWHFMLQAKLDVTQPVLMSGLFFLLMGYRLLQRFEAADRPLALALLAVVVAAATAGLEAGWYQVVNHVPASRVLAANLDLDTIRPAWWVLVVGLAAVVLRLARPFWARRPPAPRSAAAARAAV